MSLSFATLLETAQKAVEEALAGVKENPYGLLYGAVENVTDALSPSEVAEILMDRPSILRNLVPEAREFKNANAQVFVVIAISREIEKNLDFEPLRDVLEDWISEMPEHIEERFFSQMSHLAL
jgi:hypothetical protein